MTTTPISTQIAKSWSHFISKNTVLIGSCVEHDLVLKNYINTFCKGLQIPIYKAPYVVMHRPFNPPEKVAEFLYLQETLRNKRVLVDQFHRILFRLSLLTPITLHDPLMATCLMIGVGCIDFKTDNYFESITQMQLDLTKHGFNQNNGVSSDIARSEPQKNIK